MAKENALYLRDTTDELISLSIGITDSSSIDDIFLLDSGCVTAK